MATDSRGQDNRPVIGEFPLIVGTIAEYELASDLTGIFADPPLGLVAHFGGAIGDSILAGSLWSTRERGLTFFADRTGVGLTELAHQLAAPDRDPDLTYTLMTIEAATIGAAAPEFDRRPRGEAGGAVLVRGPVRELPPSDHPGLVVAARITEADGGKLYEFRASAPEVVPEGAEVVSLHALFTTAHGLEELAQEIGD